MPWTHAISSSDLYPLIGSPDLPTLLDVTLDADVAQDPYLLPTAIRVPFTDIVTCARAKGITSAVVICQKGKKLSQGAAAALRAEGISARYLEGGNLGWRAFAPGLRVTAARAPSAAELQRAYILPSDCGADTIAQAWLLKRFVTPNAQVWWISPSDAAEVADRFGAQVLGEKSFNTLCADLGLTCPSLAEQARALAQDTTLSQILAGLQRQHHNEDAFFAATLSVLDGLYGHARHITALKHMAPAETTA